MGVTIKIAGNCGDTFEDLPHFAERLKKSGSPTNYMIFLGQNTLRQMVGADDRYAPSTPEQLEKMKEIVKKVCLTRRWGCPAALSMRRGLRLRRPWIC